MHPIHWLLDTVLNLYSLVLIVYIVMSWLLTFNIINAHQQFVRAVMQFLYAVTEPVLSPIRRYIPSLGGVDLSVLVLWLVLQFLRRILFSVFY